MSGGMRPRMPSQSSSDSSLLDGRSEDYAVVVGTDSNQNLLPQKNGAYDTRDKSSTRCCSLAVVSLILSVVCLITVVVVSGAVFYLFVYGHQIFPKGLSDSERVCMPCGQVNPNPLAEGESPILRDLDIHLDDDGETEICCASTPAQYATFFKLIMKRQEEVKKLADVMGTNENSDTALDDVNTGSLGGRAVSAHLLTKPTSPEKHDEIQMQQWKSPAESPVSHVRAGLKYHDNKIFVQSQGLYFIYCQILFNRAHSVDGTDPEPTPRLASYYVKRHSVLYPASSGHLLKGRHTRASGEDDRHSTYVGGLFFLHAGDQLFVQVSVPQLVSHDDQASFFGLFKVGN